MDNEGLTSLEMPKLDEVVQEEEGVRVKIANNRELQMSKKEVMKLIAAAGGSDHAEIQYIEFVESE